MKILIATDGSIHCENVYDYVKSLRLSSGDQIKIITIIDMAVPMAVDMYAGYLASTTEIEKSLRENAKRIIKDATDKLKLVTSKLNVVVSNEILTGSPESRIVETAEDFEANLIIIGSHGYNRWERLLLGSVSDSVVHHAPCSVLVIRN